MTDAENFYEVAKRLLLNKKYFDAAQFLTKAIKLDPNFSDAYFLRGTIYLVRWDWDAEKYAVADFTKFTELEPDNAEGWFKRGKAFAWFHRFNPTDKTNGQACEYLTRAIKLAPDNVKYYCQRAFLKKPDAALADYAKAIELDPYNKYIYFHRAETFDKLEKFSEALADFDKAIALHENFHGTTADLSDIEYFISGHFYKARGEFYWRRNDYDAAIADFIKEIETSEPDSVLLKSACIKLRKLCKDIGKYDAELPKNHTSAMIYFARGVVNLEKTFFEDLGRAIDFDPTCTIFYVQRATAYENEGNYTAAIDDLTKAIECEPNSAKLYFRRGEIYSMRRVNDEAALADDAKAIELDKNFMDAYMRRGFIYKFFLEQPERAFEEYSRALAVEPDNKFFLRYRIDISEELKNFPALIKDFSRLISLEPTNYRNYIERAKIYFKLKNCAAALEDFNQAVGVAPYEKKTYYERGVFYWNIGEAKKAWANFIQANVAIKGMERAIKRARRIPKKLLGKMTAPINKNSVLRPEDLKGIL